MDLKLIKLHIQPVNNFIGGMALSGKASVGRTQLKKKLQEESKKYLETQIEVVDEYEGWTDKEAGKFDKNNKDLMKAMNELGNEPVTVDISTLSFHKELIEALEHYEEPLKGVEADIYGLLVEQLLVEETEEEK